MESFLRVPAFRMYPDINILVTNKQCQFAHYYFFLGGGGGSAEQRINKCKRKDKWKKIKLFICVNLIFTQDFITKESQVMI